jgi:hydrogenase maturation protease
MTLQVVAAPVGTTPVEILVCGSADRGDDGAPIVAAALLQGRLPDGVRMQIVGGIDVEHLLELPDGAGFVIVDAATGLLPGEVVDLPAGSLRGRRDEPRPRSSHSIAFSEVIGLAELIRDTPLNGRIVAIGGAEFRLGSTLSPPVAGSIPRLVSTILEAIAGVRGSRPLTPGS